MAGSGYAELRAKSCFSFLRGASQPDELVERAAALGLVGLGIADLETLAGAVRAHVAAKEAGLRLLVGAEVAPRDGPAAVLYPTDRAAYGRLSRLITVGRRRAPKGRCELTVEDVAGHSTGLLAILVPPERLDAAALGGLARLAEAFPGAAYLAIERHLGPLDERRAGEVAAAGRALGLALVAVNDVHYHDAGRRPLQDVLTCIRERVPIAAAGRRLFPNGERRLKPAAEMARLFAGREDAVERTLEVLERVRFSLDDLRYEYPEEIVPPGETARDHLARLTWEGASGRYPGGPPDRVRRQLEHELALIGELRYEPFFLTVHDVVRFARSRGILCQGRGSAANSAVCFCLGITSVDPARTDVLFERFVSRERNEPPDIDVDFEHERREEVIQYIYTKYGRERAGIVAEVIRYRPRSAIRDVGKALGLSLDQVDRLAGSLEWWDGLDEVTPETVRAAGLDPADRTVERTIALAREIQGFPRHLSQHVGGFVITRGPLSELVPIENAAMEDRTVIEWDKDDIDALGILKVDCLALGMLTCIRKAFGLIEAAHGASLALATVPPEDPETYEMCCRADTLGVFQIESRAQMAMLPRLKPREFYDLVVEVAIVRPGPIQGGMVHPYLRRRAGEEPVTYPSRALEEVLRKTLGVPLFQEQAMRLSIVGAGFTPGEADQLRRAMAAWRRPGVLERFHEKLVEGMKRNGVSADFAERIWDQIRGFGEYGFPESHAASFALLVYVSAWLKRRYPAAFYAALLNSQPMGFYAPAQIVRDAREHGVEVRPVDVAASEYDCTLEGGGGGPAPDGAAPAAWGAGGPALRLGLRLVRGIGERRAAAVVEARRRGGPFRSIADLVRRCRPQAAEQASLVETLCRLAAADAYRSLGLERRRALWEVAAVAETPPLFFGVDLGSGGDLHLPAMSARERTIEDYEAVGLSLERHPVSFVRDELRALGAVEAAQVAKLPAGVEVLFGGLVTVRQRPATANGIVFITVEDETGFGNLIVRPRVLERCRAAACAAPLVLAEGRIERAGEVVHVLARTIRSMAEAVAGLRAEARSFR
jgi:error-prone DNA polymerase